MATAPETQVERFIQDGQNEKAVELLCQLALASAQNGDIAKSEGFRDRLYEVDGMALDHIVQVNEAIEALKSQMLTPDFRCQWAPLFKKLSSEEAHLFFFALQTLHVDSEQVILEQGHSNDKLYLIQEGRLKVVYMDKDKDMLIRTLGPCDLFGQETFFSINVSTVTVKTLSPVRLQYIDRAALARLKGDACFSEANLKSACTVGPSLSDRLQQKGLDRRSHKRFRISGKLNFRMLSATCKQHLSRTIRAELWDISKGGLSFYIASKDPGSVCNLIGHTLEVKFGVAICGRLKPLTLTGVVQGVASHPMDEYSVHLRLMRLFSDAAIQAIQTSASYR